MSEPYISQPQNASFPHEDLHTRMRIVQKTWWALQLCATPPSWEGQRATVKSRVSWRHQLPCLNENSNGRSWTQKRVWTGAQIRFFSRILWITMKQWIKNWYKHLRATFFFQHVLLQHSNEKTFRWWGQLEPSSILKHTETKEKTSICSDDQDMSNNKWPTENPLARQVISLQLMLDNLRPGNQFPN
jgi:hypothetical protein